jgi:sugar phosphate isomerase/epimerase
MAIQFFCPRWGSEDLNWDEFCKKAKEAGYNGIEYGIARTVSEKELDTVWKTAEKYNLTIIAQHYDTYEADFQKHFELYNAWLEKIKIYPVIKINSQTGKDFFSFEENKQLVDVAEQFALNIVHETHRNKFLFAAHIAKEYLEKIPALKISLDASHWVCVAESYLEDQAAALDIAIERTEHIHARVGYPEGPQVPDPRILIWEQALNVHLEWWDRVALRKKKDNQVLTITPEFGPFPYMVHAPLTGEPVCDQWEVNVFMMNLLRKRYEK